MGSNPTLSVHATAGPAVLPGDANVVLLILSVYLWYWGALDAVPSDAVAVPTIGAQRLTNFVLSPAMAGVSCTVQRSRLA